MFNFLMKIKIGFEIQPALPALLQERNTTEEKLRHRTQTAA